MAQRDSKIFRASFLIQPVRWAVDYSSDRLAIWFDRNSVSHGKDNRVYGLRPICLSKDHRNETSFRNA